MVSVISSSDLVSILRKVEDSLYCSGIVCCVYGLNLKISGFGSKFVFCGINCPVVKSTTGEGFVIDGGFEPSEGPVLWLGLQSLNIIFCCVKCGSVSTSSPIWNLPEIISISSNFGII